MIKINSFTPVNNFARRSWEFYDDHMILKTKSLTVDFEDEIEYEKIKTIRSRELADLYWIWASFITIGLYGLASLVLGWFDINIPFVIERTVVVFALLMLIPAFRRYEYYSFFDKDQNVLATVRVHNKSKRLLLEAIKIIKQKAEISSETYFTDSFPNAPHKFQYNELDFPDFLNKVQIRFYDDRLVGVEKSLVEKVTTVIRYNEFNGKTQVVKIANDRWDSVWGYWLYFVCITFLSIIFLLGKQVQGNYLLLNLFYGGLGLLIPLFFLRYIKSEVVIFYNKKNNGIFWININSKNREEINQIVDFVKGKVEFQNQKPT